MNRDQKFSVTHCFCFVELYNEKKNRTELKRGKYNPGKKYREQHARISIYTHFFVTSLKNPSLLPPLPPISMLNMAKTGCWQCQQQIEQH